MNEDAIIRELEELAEVFGLHIRYEPIRMDDDLMNVAGGVCRLKGESVLIINSNATVQDKIKTLVEAVRHFDIDGVYIHPALRERLEKAR